MKKHFCFEVNKKRELKFDFQFLVYNQLTNPFYSAGKDFDYFKYLTLEKLKEHDPNDIKHKTKIIPIGSIEYVLEWFRKFYNVELKPINIPYQLFAPTFLKRKCGIWPKNELLYTQINGKKFIKSAERFKGICDIYDSKKLIENQNDFIDDYYIVSDVVDIISEYRVFVFKNAIQDIRKYVGDYQNLLSLNDIREIELMVKKLEDKAPVAYTLDVGLKFNKQLSQRDLFVIEMHDFFSVGLYGFDSEKIPYMFSQWFYWKLKELGIKF